MLRYFGTPSVLTVAARPFAQQQLKSSSVLRLTSLYPYNNFNNSIFPTNNNNNNKHNDIAIRFRSNRSSRGLYDGKDIRTGNSLSFSMKATKRKFKPNVFIKRIYSEVLDEMIKFHLTTSALRSIDKAGGLDNYLLTSKHVTSGEGLAIKKRVVKKLKLEEKRRILSDEN